MQVCLYRFMFSSPIKSLSRRCGFFVDRQNIKVNLSL